LEGPSFEIPQKVANLLFRAVNQMPIGRCIDRIGNLEHRALKIRTHSPNQFIAIQFRKPIHGHTPPGQLKPETLFNHPDGKIGRPVALCVTRQNP
jgi:hypothetical protein